MRAKIESIQISEKKTKYVLKGTSALAASFLLSTVLMQVSIDMEGTNDKN